MDQTVSLLQNVTEAARMGIDSVEMLLQKTDDTNMQNELTRQRGQYEKAEQDAEARLNELGAHSKAKGPMTRAGAWMGIQMDTLTDQSASHLADMLIQGATMGVIEVTRAQAANPQADRQAHTIAADYVKNEQDSIERLKGFL